MINDSFGGKANDVRCDLKNILSVVYPESTVSFEIPSNQSWFTDQDWINQYPQAREIYRIYGSDPSSYVSKDRIK